MVLCSNLVGFPQLTLNRNDQPKGDVCRICSKKSAPLQKSRVLRNLSVYHRSFSARINLLVLCRLRLQSCWKTVRKLQKQWNLWKERCIPEWMVKRLHCLWLLHLFQELTQSLLLFRDLTFGWAVGQGPALQLGMSWKTAHKSVPFPGHQRQW